MKEILTSPYAITMYWVLGDALFVIMTVKGMNKRIKKDCVCLRAQTRNIGNRLSRPSTRAITYAELSMVGLLWIVLIPGLLLDPLLTRNKPKCEHCGEYIRVPRAERTRT